MDTLAGLGADVVISLSQSREGIQKAIKDEARQQPFSMVLDYLWGEPAELVLEVLTGHDLEAEAHLPIKYIQIGEMAGPAINLQAATLRSSAIELSGQGGGSLPREIMASIPTVIIPEIFRLAVAGKLLIETEAVPLKDISAAWQKEDERGKRIVVTM
jgi:hypothetical protein